MTLNTSDSGPLRRRLDRESMERSRRESFVSSIARLLGVSHATIYKYVPELGGGTGPPPCAILRLAG